LLVFYIFVITVLKKRLLYFDIVIFVTDSVVMERRVVELEPTSVNSADSKYSVQALAALAEVNIN
jgi:hypothetical protein